MNQIKNILKSTEPKNLGDYIRLVIAFFGCLILIGVYQQLRLYGYGVLDSVFSKNLLLLWVNHSGFSALLALLVVFPFRWIENSRSGWGFKAATLVFTLVLAFEIVFTEYFVQYFELPETGFWKRYFSHISGTQFILTLFISGVALLNLMRWLYKLSAYIYPLIGRMYPFTIILFSLFLATLNAEKKPVNENKSQHLVTEWVLGVVDMNKYEGSEEYPLLKPYPKNDHWGSYIRLDQTKPNILLINIEGLSTDFIGEDKVLSLFTPNLNQYSREGLYWKNFLSNTGEGNLSLPTLLGSLPFGKTGFTDLNELPARNTLMSSLKELGYWTSFNYGGNASIYQWDRFMFQERVDEFIDQKSYGPAYARQEEDFAGNSPGYPDEALFKRFLEEFIETDKPRFDVFQTLSAREPFSIPRRDHYMKKVEGYLDADDLEPREKRLIGKNKEFFAAMLYTDEAIGAFMTHLRETGRLNNTIVLLTGTHRNSELPFTENIERYRVPLILVSDRVQHPDVIPHLASHMDVYPGVLNILSGIDSTNIPSLSPILGRSLISGQIFGTNKNIPLLRNRGNIKDYIQERFFISGSSVYALNENLGLDRDISEEEERNAIHQFKTFRAINTYVTENNKILPDSLRIFNPLIKKPNKKEMIWINSVFNGDNFDNAYSTAREMAIHGERERALLLCNYILNKVPGHADSEILMGRIHAWEGDYIRAIDILEQTVLKYPVYADGYSALLDVYYWSGSHKQALLLQNKVERHLPGNQELIRKIERARQIAQQPVRSTSNSSDLATTGNFYE